MLKKELLGKL